MNIKLVVSNQSGVLAKVAAEIAGERLEHRQREPRAGRSTLHDMHFTLQVFNRLHLAQIMRGLRRLPEVIRITRLKG